MLKITEFAKLCGVSVHTLRYYDKCNILCPRETDPSSGYRYYHPEQKKDVETILTLKDLGFSLEDIREFLTGGASKRRNMLGLRKLQLYRESCILQENIKKIDKFSEDKNLGYYHYGTSFSEIPFEDDPRMLGRWDYCGYLPDNTEFTSEEILIKDFFLHKTLFLLPRGEEVWTYAWSKNVIYCHLLTYNLIVSQPCTLFSANGETYLAVQWISAKIIGEENSDGVRIFRQIDTAIYTQETAQVFQDDLNLPYHPDPKIIGYWKTIDFVTSPDLFSPGKRNEDFSSFTYMYDGIHFYDNGEALMVLPSIRGLIEAACRYTAGYIITEQFTLPYEYRRHKNNDYLIMEHKNGDYVHTGMIGYYVFRREDKNSDIQTII